MLHAQVVLMDSSISAYSAFSLMAANEHQSVPVWDSRADRYCGMLTATDLLQLILLCSDSKEHESCVQGMRDMDLDHFISNYSRPPWGEQLASLELRPDDDLMSVLRTLSSVAQRSQLFSLHDFIRIFRKVLFCPQDRSHDA